MHNPSLKQFAFGQVHLESNQQPSQIPNTYDLATFTFIKVSNVAALLYLYKSVLLNWNLYLIEQLFQLLIINT